MIHGVNDRDRRRRVHRDRRPLGLRQVDAAADGRRASRRSPPARSRSAAASSTASSPRTATSRWCSRTTRSIRTCRCTTTWPTGCASARMSKADIDARVQRAAEILELGALPRPQAARALRRPAPARGDGPRDRARAGGVPVRRAAVQPRRQAARADARRAAGAAPAAGDDQPVRHPRPGRGDDARAPHDRDERRARGADRRAARGLRQARHDVRRRLHRLAADEPHSDAARRARHAARRAARAPGALRASARRR